MKSTFAYLVLSMIIIIAFGNGADFHDRAGSTASISTERVSDSIEDTPPISDEHSSTILTQRHSANEFQHQRQATPSYDLAFEFLAEDLSAKHFVYIRTIPDTQPWFELTSFVANKARISGWKFSRPQRPSHRATLRLS